MLNKSFRSFSSDHQAPAFEGAIRLCILAMLCHMVLAGGRIAVTLAALELGMSTVVVGVLTAAFAVLPMCFSVRAGRWMDRVGAFKPTVLGVGLVCIGALLPILVQNPLTLMITACCVGIGVMLTQVATQNLLGYAAPPVRIRNFSWLSIALAGSGFAGPLIAGLAIDHFGYRYAFAALSLPPILALIGVYFQRRVLRDTIAHVAPADETPRRVAELLAMPELRRVLLVNTILSGAWDAHLFVVPLYCVSIGLSATDVGVILAAFATGTFVIRVILPLLRRRMRAWTLVRATMIIAFTDYLLYPMFSHPWALIGLSFVLGLALGTCQPTMLAMLHQHSPPSRVAEAGGLRMAMINASQVSLPLTFGALGALIGVAPLFLAYAVALGTAGWLNRHPPGESDRTST